MKLWRAAAWTAGVDGGTEELFAGRPRDPWAEKLVAKQGHQRVDLRFAHAYLQGLNARKHKDVRWPEIGFRFGTKG